MLKLSTVVIMLCCGCGPGPVVAGEGEGEATEGEGESAPGEGEGEGELGEGEGDNGEVEGEGEGELAVDRPSGQCRRDDDCPVNAFGEQSCLAQPGGVCGGCGTDDHCPGVSTCFDGVGVCITECGDNNDCPLGMRCGAGRCVREACTNNICPSPWFVCDDTNFCARASCTSQLDCPLETTCELGVCLEPQVP